VYVIHEAEKLNTAGQNSLLKTLEEPPTFCVIILLCTKTEALLPTIHSRCRMVRFGLIDKAHIMSALKERGIPAPAAAYWSGFADGSLGQALTWATLDCDGKSVYDLKKDLLLRLGEFRLADTIELAEWLSQAAKMVSSALGKIAGQVSTTDINRRGQKLMIQMILWAISDAMKISLGVTDGLVNADQRDMIEKLASRLDSDRAAELVLRGHQKIQWIDSSVNEKLIFEGLLLNLAGLDILSANTI
jgi:DNA polymerase-3 subunit delta'